MVVRRCLRDDTFSSAVSELAATLRNSSRPTVSVIVRTREDTVAPSRRFFLVIISPSCSSDGYPANSPLPTRLSNLLGKVPKTSAVKKLACLWIPFRSPLRSEPHRGRCPLISACGNQNNALLRKPLVSVLERLLVDSFEVGKVALVVQCFAELQSCQKPRIR
jgi:hypothetical protein